LPVEQRIRADFQDSTHVHRGVPQSTHRGTQSHTVTPTPFVIRSAATDAVQQDIFRQTKRAFRTAAPSTWNSLPASSGVAARTFGRPVLWSNLPPFRLRFWKPAGPSRGGEKEGKFSLAPHCLGAPPLFKNTEKVLQIATFWPPQICIKSIFSRDSAPDPAGPLGDRAYDAPLTPNQVVRGQ